MAEVPRAESLELEEFLKCHGDRLLRSAFLLCGNETEAQDLVQETLLQAIQSQHRFRGESAVYTWVHGILLNVSRRHYRKGKRLVLDEERVLEEVLPSALPDAGDKEFCAAKLTHLLQKLSPEHREVVVLRYYENLKLEDIARRTEVSLGTVKSRLHYAVRCLERWMPKEMNLFVTGDTHNRGT